MEISDVILISFPTFVIISAVFFLYYINRRYRKNILKKIFSGLLLLFITITPLHLVRFIFTEHLLLLSRIILMLYSFYAPIFFLLAWVFYKGEFSLNYLYLFLTSFILTILVWQPNSVYLEDGKYVVAPFLFLPYLLVNSIFMIPTTLLFYLSYKKYPEVKNKIRYFFIASLLPLLTFLIMGYFIGRGELEFPKLVLQTYSFSLMILLMMYGYWRG